MSHTFVCGGRESVRLRSGVVLRCAARAPALQVVDAWGREQRFEVDWARGNFGGSEIVVSRDERLAVLFIDSGQSEQGYALFALEPEVRALGGLPYVWGEGVAPMFSPDGGWLAMAMTSSLRVRDTGVDAEEALDADGHGELLIDWAQLFVQRMPDGAVQRFDIGMRVPASTNPDSVYEWNTYELLSFVAEDRLELHGPDGFLSTVALPPTGPITLARPS